MESSLLNTGILVAGVILALFTWFLERYRALPEDRPKVPLREVVAAKRKSVFYKSTLGGLFLCLILNASVMVYVGLKWLDLSQSSGVIVSKLAVMYFDMIGVFTVLIAAALWWVTKKT